MADSAWLSAATLPDAPGPPRAVDDGHAGDDPFITLLRKAKQQGSSQKGILE